MDLADDTYTVTARISPGILDLPLSDIEVAHGVGSYAGITLEKPRAVSHQLTLSTAQFSLVQVDVIVTEGTAAHLAVDTQPSHQIINGQPLR